MGSHEGSRKTEDCQGTAGIGRNRVGQSAIRTPGEGTDRYWGKLGSAWLGGGVFSFSEGVPPLAAAIREGGREVERERMEDRWGWWENSPFCVSDRGTRDGVEREGREEGKESGNRARSGSARCSIDHYIPPVPSSPHSSLFLPRHPPPLNSHMRAVSLGFHQPGTDHVDADIIKARRPWTLVNRRRARRRDDVGERHAERLEMERALANFRFYH